MTTPRESPVTRWLKNTNGFFFSLYATLAAFCCYTCVYAFRKTFSVALFDGLTYAGIDYKVWLVTFQVLGYACSKFAGIKVIAELKSTGRAKGILLMVSIAGLSWLLFAVVPAPYNIVFLFTNGFPLGLVWGMIFGYLEGRRCTEVLGAGLSVSFIFSAGFAKSTGAYIMRDWHVSELWMPFTTACIFLAPLIFFLYLLDQLPPPNADDERLRTKRQPMNAVERRRFVNTFWPGIVLFTLSYMLLTAYRDFRDNFSIEIWTALGFGDSPEIFTTTEVPITMAVLVVMGSIMLIKNNKLALMMNHVIILVGIVLIGISTWLLQQAALPPVVWMVLVGLGLYLGYVPFNSIFFDRMLATFRYTGTVGFVMYVADAFGYLASVCVLLYKESGYAGLSWLDFFVSCGYVLCFAGGLLTIASMIYFHLRYRQWTRDESNALPSVAALPEAGYRTQ